MYPTVAWQGKVVAVRLISAESVSEVSGSFLGNKFNCYRSGDDYQGVVGVPIDQKVGHYDLKLFITKNDGTKTEISKKMKVWETRFPFSRFWLKPARNKLRARNIINNEWAEIEQVLQVEGQEKLWQGKFSWPVKARVSQGFGHREIINGKRAGNHRGLDIAVISGTKIIAPNSAKVVFAKRLKAFGGTLVLDHGQGIHTLYFHLSKLIAKVGDEVGKGELIALSGNSGISSGAHLHWGMSAHNLRVDPLQWTKYEI
ncbi:MAG: M23 family metallopeptidase [Candidatus Margulisbacteria bacterium]|nr:M23 family metallopeptidase [Candidatus Margulisiibacteriota bacterium]